MGSAWQKISSYGIAFGAACTAPSVDTLNAVSALAAGKMLLDVAPFVVLPAAAAATRLREQFNMKALPARSIKKAMKVGLLSGAALLGGITAYNTYDDVVNDNQDFAHALGSNVAMPVYNLARSATTNIVIPAGRDITRGLNGFIESTTGYDMPEMNVTPVFSAQSSMRARCFEPAVYILLDGSIAALDQKITGREHTQNAQEAIDTLTMERQVYYERPPICS